MKKVGIIGCGWLGFQLAHHLQSRSHSVWGTVTSKQAERERGFPLIDYISPNDGPFPACDVAIVSIPFSRTLQNPEFYVNQVIKACERAMDAGAKYIIWTSSTGIYPKQAGVVSETTALIPDNGRQMVMVAIEARLQSLAVQTLSVRLGGLFGYDRLIVPALSKRNMSRPDGPVNLIHQCDVVRVLGWCVSNQPTGRLNLVAPEHPIRSELYADWAIRLGIPAPSFSAESLTKIVTSTRLESEFGLSLRYPDPKQWIRTAVYQV